MLQFNSIKQVACAVWNKLFLTTISTVTNEAISYIPEFMYLDSPPANFPHGRELGAKLQECLELEIIVSCVHKQSTQDDTYFVEIQLPCSTCEQKDYQKFSLFIDAMEKCYKLRVVAKEAVPQQDAGYNLYKILFKHHNRS